MPYQIRHRDWPAGGGRPPGAFAAGHPSLFVLQLAQATRSGLVVVANAAQAAFVQNLIYYLCRA